MWFENSPFIARLGPSSHSALDCGFCVCVCVTSFLVCSQKNNEHFSLFSSFQGHVTNTVPFWKHVKMIETSIAQSFLIGTCLKIGILFFNM